MMAYKSILSVVTPHIKTADNERKKDMEFLEKVLGEELYKQVAEKINAHNGNEANKDNQIKIGNLGTGEYVSKLKYDDIANQIAGKETELQSANDLIAELKKASKGNEEMQNKIGTYETQVAELQAQLRETKIKSAVKVGLLAEHCTDVDYVTYKLMESLKEKGESLELDENDNIKNWEGRLSGLKTQLPTQFPNNADDGDGFVPVENKGLPKSYTDKSVTKEQFRNMTYEERVALKQSNEKLYNQLAK